MSSEKIFNALGKLSDDLISEAEIIPSAHKNTTLRFRWKPLVAACLVICLFAALITIDGKQTIDNPLIIKAHAVSVDGQPYIAQLSLNERIQLVETEFFFEGENKYENKYYAFDLTLAEGMYLHLAAVDDQWNPILDKSIHYGDEEANLPCWALKEGNDIAVIGTDLEGNVLDAYVNGTAQPRMKDKSMIWRVNNEGMNRCIIDCFDEDFNCVVSYYLEITECDGLFYAEIVKIV